MDTQSGRVCDCKLRLVKRNGLYIQKLIFVMLIAILKNASPPQAKRKRRFTEVSSSPRLLKTKKNAEISLDLKSKINKTIKGKTHFKKGRLELHHIWQRRKNNAFFYFIKVAIFYVELQNKIIL